MSPPPHWRNEPLPAQPPAPKAALAIASVLWLHLFLLIVVLVVGRSVGSALFLSNFDGQGLAGIYFLVGLAVASLVTLFDRLHAAAKGPFASILTLLLLLVTTLGAGFLFLAPHQEHSPWLYGLFYLLIESFAFVTTVQFWGTANAALSLDLARKLYIIVATGGIFGSIAGGLLTRWLAPVPVAVQMFVMAGILPAQLLLILLFDALSTKISRWHPKSQDGWNLGGAAKTVDLANRTQRPPLLHASTQQQPYTENSLLIPFGLVSLLMVFSTTLVDYYYKMHADQRYLGDTEELTWFFGSFYLLVGISTLVTQLAVTPIVLRFGTSFLGLWTSPIALSAMALFNAIWPGVWPAAAFKLTDSVLGHSVYRSCQEMLYTPLPTRWAQRLKTHADGVYGRYGLMLAGLFLYLIAPLSPRQHDGWLIFWILVALALWALAIGRLRISYRMQAATPSHPSPPSRLKTRSLLEALTPSVRSLEQKGT